jgi:tetratricopeptide (TPR) repeat protein/transcriptional regulator with XRE-family HTH domain
MPPSDGAELAEELRRMKDRAGLSLAQLATRTWYSKSSLERYINGKVFPPRRVVEAISDSCGGDTDALIAAWERAWSTQRDRIGQPPRPERADRAGESRPVPMELPADLPDFTGRLAYRAALEAQLCARDSAAPAIAVICGMAGAGKTALAVHAAHRIRDYYPDGQLYLHLAGMSEQPVRPRDALGQLLRSLGVDGGAIPDGIEERAALYRSHLATRRILVFADDAASADQVRPLVPGTSAAALIVTSRTRLAALAGARLHQLEPFRAEEAVQLLRELVGAHRVDADPEVAGRLVANCGNLPLAIRIAGARLASGLRADLADLAARLADERLRLGELAVGDIAVRSSLELSYRALPPVPRAALGRLATRGLSRCTTWMVAALAGVDLAGAERVVDGLLAANLLADAGADGAGTRVFALHDLVRDYARERAADASGDQASGDEARAERDAATDRLLGAALDHTERAEVAFSHRFFPPPPPGAPRWRPADAPVAAPADPMAWFVANRGFLIHAVGLACDTGRVGLAAELAALLSSFFAAHSDWAAWRSTHESVLVASGGTDPYALRGLAELEVYLDRSTQALSSLDRARRRLREAGDLRSTAYVYILLGVTHRKGGRFRATLRYLGLAAQQFEDLDDDRGRAQINYQLGVHRVYQQRLADAEPLLRQALAGFRAGDDTRDVAWCCYWLGVTERLLGHPEPAQHWQDLAEHEFTRLSERAAIATCLREKAELLRLRGRLDEATALAVKAIGVHRDLGDRSGELSDLMNLGVIIGTTDPARGIAVLERARDRAAEQGRQPMLTRVLKQIGELRERLPVVSGPVA